MDGSFPLAFIGRPLIQSVTFFDPIDLDDTDVFQNSGSGGGITETEVEISGSRKDKINNKEVYLKFLFKWGRLKDIAKTLLQNSA